MSGTTSQQVVVWARAQLGKQIGKGECWDLADGALKQAGAKSSADLGPMGDDADYVWGDEVSDLKDVQSGDILQFRDFAVTTTTETETRYADGSTDTYTSESTFTRPHHTAVVSEVKGGGLLKILEQNVAPAGKKVQLNSLHTKDVPAAKKETQKQTAKVIVTTTSYGERVDLGLSSEEITRALGNRRRATEDAVWQEAVMQWPTPTA